MTSEKLAMHGGSRTLRSALPLRWYQLRRGVTRSLDLMTMLPMTLRGVTSITRGGIIGRFEEAFAEMTGAKHALAMNSGTATLHSAYFALGVGPGTEVIVPSYAWHAIATPILQCGAVPVFCEIDPRTLTADPEDIERRVTARPRVISVLHTWGNPAPMDRILEIAGRHGLGVVEDCSHAHGATYQGRSVGTWGHVGCFSLQGSKAVDGGEAGVAITDDPKLYDHMVLLGHNYLVASGQKAQTFGFGDISLGVKYRPHPAAMFLSHTSLRRLAKRNAQATHAWDLLCGELAEVRGIRPIQTTPGGVRGGFYAYVLEYQGEDLGGPGTEEFVAAVQAEGVPLVLDQYRGSLLHTVPLFRQLDRRALGGGCYDPTRPWEEQLSRVALPITERLSNRLVRLPQQLHGLSDAFVRKCARGIRKVLTATLRAAAPASPLPVALAGRPRSATGT
jgi:dTDP-4-amino-4,6-dideoxygalactose transaminase